MSYVDSVMVYTNFSCNLHCPRCFLRDLSARQKSYQMTAGQFEDVLVALERQNIQVGTLHLSGGEPTLWPYLCWAIRRAKDSGVVARVRVLTNGIGRQAQDYGQADVVRVMHYGAQNREDIRVLRRILGRRLEIHYGVHLDWPFAAEAPLPAVCSCAFWTFVGDRVYPCGFYRPENAAQSVGVQDDFASIFGARDPRRQELCRRCLNNQRNARYRGRGLRWEFGIWDTCLSVLGGLSHKPRCLSGAYRFWRYTIRGVR